MKAKKNSKKNRTTRNNIPYTAGRNMFGEKAETHFIVLERETAFQQIMDCISQLDGSSKEFTFDMRCFNGHEEELEQVMAKVKAFMALKTSLEHKSLLDCSDMLGKIA